MGQTILAGDPPITVTLKRSARARRLVLRVSRHDGRVTLTLPDHVSERKAMDFARTREGWLREALSALPPTEAVGPGTRLPVLGQALVLAPARVRAPRREGDVLVVPEGRPAAATAAWLKALARDRLAEASDRHAARLGRPYSALRLRDTRSRWGSCSSEGILMYSWRLVMAPEAVLDYVAAHEVAHLARMDHSPAFWEVVARLCPDHARHRRWLREHGGSLHRFAFAD
ncbi:M48 family metallopeptidase [Palleronia sp. KMU-117]|uniref:M48 family metallopeptidase n=1 Tax=Palleronia sp. KMU-117 TaxID=3434108 RepID=UPI003D722026